MNPKDHERIIENAFGPKSNGPRLSDRDRATLKHASRHVDSLSPQEGGTGQGRANSFMHAMRGPHQTVANARRLADAFVSDQLQIATKLVEDPHSSAARACVRRFKPRLSTRPNQMGPRT
jgi:hypothetical protein